MYCGAEGGGVICSPRSGPKDTATLGPGKITGKELDREEVAVHPGADYLCSPPGRIGHASVGSLPEDGHHRPDLLPMEEENRKLKQLVADLSLDKQMLQDVLRKKG